MILRWKNDAKFDDDIMDATFNVIVIFPNFGQFAAIGKQNSEWKANKYDRSINKKLHLIKTKNKTKNTLAQYSLYCFKVDPDSSENNNF